MFCRIKYWDGELWQFGSMYLLDGPSYSVLIVHYTDWE